MNKLTSKQIQRVKPNPDKIHCLYDGGGLQLTIKPTGSKLWEILYTSPLTKKRRRSSIGTYPEVSLQTARENSQTYKTLIAKGIDPIEYKRGTQRDDSDDKNNTRLFNDIIDDWLSLKKRDLSQRTYTKRVQQFDKFVKPHFKNISIDKVTHPLIATVLETKAKTSIETAYRMYNYINQIYLYSISKGYCQYNVVANIDIKSILPKMQTRHHPKITDLKVLKELKEAIENYNGNISVKNALRLVLHLPLRASNLVNLKWSQINFKTRVLIIPREQMKVKDINLSDFKVYLSDEVIDIHQEQRELQKSNNKNSTFVFTSNIYSNKPINKESPNCALRVMGFNDISNKRKISLHGFRGTFRSLADTYQIQHNATFEAKEAVLDHHGASKIVKAYNHEADYFEQLKSLLTWWSNFLQKL
jgi:integrase